LGGGKPAREDRGWELGGQIYGKSFGVSDGKYRLNEEMVQAASGF